MTLRRAATLAMMLASALGLAAPLLAQTPPNPQNLPVAGGGNQIRRAEILPDRRILFKFRAPTATDVKLLVGDAAIGRAKTYPMTKDAAGVWSATTDPLEPEMYQHQLEMGGARVESGYVTVPGTPPQWWEVQTVPHGSVNDHAFYSREQRRNRVISVYLPPQYFTEPNRRFPVFYMWKPGGEREWPFAGVPQVIMDNLIAQKKAVPMIVVMPDINVPEGVSLGSPEARDLLDRELVNDTIPFVEKNYRTLAGRTNRAISGISQSGATAFIVGMRHLDLFGTVGEFGTGFFGGLLNPPGYTSYLPYSPDAVTPNLHAKLKAPATRPRLVYMSVGTVDPRMPFQKKAADSFIADGIPVTFKTFAGGHEYTVWRHSFADMASLLFK